MLMPVTAAIILMTLRILPRMMIRMRRIPMITLMPQYCNNDNIDSLHRLHVLMIGMPHEISILKHFLQPLVVIDA